MKNSVNQGPWLEGQPLRNLANLVNDLRRVACQREFVRKNLQTTDATTLEIWAEVMPLNRTWHITYLIEGRDSSDNYARYHESKDLRRGSSGAASVLATTTHEFAYEDVAAWGFTVGTDSDGTITLSVNGAASTTIDWVALVTVSQAPINA